MELKEEERVGVKSIRNMIMSLVVVSLPSATNAKVHFVEVKDDGTWEQKDKEGFNWICFLPENDDGSYVCVRQGSLSFTKSGTVYLHMEFHQHDDTPYRAMDELACTGIADVKQDQFRVMIDNHISFWTVAEKKSFVTFICDGLRQEEK